jgi:hypothetical protein
MRNCLRLKVLKRTNLYFSRFSFSFSVGIVKTVLWRHLTAIHLSERGNPYFLCVFNNLTIRSLLDTFKVVFWRYCCIILFCCSRNHFWSFKFGKSEIPLLWLWNLLRASKALLCVQIILWVINLWKLEKKEKSFFIFHF